MMDQWSRTRSLQSDHADFERQAKETRQSRGRNEKGKAALDESLDRGLEDTFPRLRSPSRRQDGHN